MAADHHHRAIAQPSAQAPSSLLCYNSSSITQTNARYYVLRQVHGIMLHQAWASRIAKVSVAYHTIRDVTAAYVSIIIALPLRSDTASGVSVEHNKNID